ncbi:hypothetical protein GNM61_24750 [Salmonella enterica]|nr:hypothetical protein [Salmonella enterica]
MAVDRSTTGWSGEGISDNLKNSLMRQIRDINQNDRQRVRLETEGLQLYPASERLKVASLRNILISGGSQEPQSASEVQTNTSVYDSIVKQIREARQRNRQQAIEMTGQQLKPIASEIPEFLKVRESLKSTPFRHALIAASSQNETVAVLKSVREQTQSAVESVQLWQTAKAETQPVKNVYDSIVKQIREVQQRNREQTAVMNGVQQKQVASEKPEFLKVRDALRAVPHQEPLSVVVGQAENQEEEGREDVCSQQSVKADKDLRANISLLDTLPSTPQGEPGGISAEELELELENRLSKLREDEHNDEYIEFPSTPQEEPGGISAEELELENRLSKLREDEHNDEYIELPSTPQEEPGGISTEELENRLDNLRNMGKSKQREAIALNS